MIRTLTILLFFSISIFSQTKSKTTIEWKTFNQDAYSIQYPATWQLSQNEQTGTLSILSPLENKKDKFKENVNFLFQNLAGQNISLDKYIEITETQVKTMLGNSKLIESTRMKKDDNEFHKLIYSGDLENKKLKFEQFVWIIDEQAYVLTFTCFQDTFLKYKTTGEKILNSFTINK